MRLDSNTIQIPFDSINGIDYNNSKFVHSQPTKNGQILKDTYLVSSNDLPVGISKILVDDFRQQVSIDTSAKILCNEYLQGINLNTYSQWIDSINNLGIVSIDKNKAFEQGIFQKIDTTNNINLSSLYDLDNSWTEVLGYLEVAKLNKNFDIVSYSRKNNQGITYKGNQTTEKNRLIMYRKYLDLLKATNKDFLKSLNRPVEILNTTKNILRVESNHTSFRSIKERLKIDSISIKEVLTNGRNPNPLMLDKITQPHRVNQLLMIFNEYNPEDYDLNDVIKLEGIKNIIINANYCESSLKSFVKRYTTESMFRWWWYGGNSKKSIKGFKPLLDELKIKAANSNAQDNKVIELIRTTMLQDKVA